LLACDRACLNSHFQARGLFDHVLVNEQGTRLSALPVSVAGKFRAPTLAPLAAPLLGANNSEFNI